METTYELQAETDATWSSGIVDTKHAGYTGSGFVDTDNAIGAWIEWTIDVDTDTNATCVFMYACASETRSMDLSISGNDNQPLSFTASGAWTTRVTETADVILTAGSNAIRLTATTSGGAPNMDKMDITLKCGAVVTPTPTPTPPPTPSPCADCTYEIAFDTEGTGVARQWHQVIITFWGPNASETDSYNPFYNYRLDVTFRNGGKAIVVPGYFAADGDAANTSASSGDRWRVHFVPDTVGDWTFSTSFRKGTNVSVDSNPLAGEPIEPDGITGSFTVLPTDKSGRDNRYLGTMVYAGEHYPLSKGTGEYFITMGSQSPENFLGYGEFDNTVDHGGGGGAMKDGVHWYEPHIQDWRPGDPTWKNGKGKGIIGALNYLASKGMNFYYSLFYNADGDCRETYPFIDYKEYGR